MDPVSLFSNEWSEIGKLLTSLWIMVGLIVFVAANALISLIFIPSLVATFHLPPVAQKTRPSPSIVSRTGDGGETTRDSQRWNSSR